MRTTFLVRLSLVGAALVAVAGVLAGTTAPFTGPGLEPAADTSQFDPGNIISDAMFFDGGSMSAAEIDAFIAVKGSSCNGSGPDGTPCLKDFRQDTTARAADTFCNGYTPGAAESAGTIIYKVSVSCDISPRVLLVMLQKEQALVTATSARLDATRYQKAMGFACPDTAPCDAAYYGFQNQVYSAARQFQRYAASPTSFGYRAGRTNTILYNPSTACGSTSVYIANQATAGLYIYTPYQPNAAALAAGYGSGDACSAYGNRNFWLYFTDWFGSTQNPAAWANLPFGSFDSVTSSYGALTVGGWMLDPDGPTLPLTVHVYVDGVFAVAATADGTRSDVGAANPAAGPNHGFTARTLAPLGWHQVCVYAINIGAGTVNPQLGCRMVDNEDAGAPIGSVDSVVAPPGTVTVGGWVFDPDSPSVSLAVHVYVDGKFALVLTAADSRPDVGTAFGVGPNHGFNAQIPATVGMHTICLYGINVGLGSTNTNLACNQVDVPDPKAYNPVGSLDTVVASGGTVALNGWVYDRDVPAGTVAVHVYVDGAFGAQVMTGDGRADVGQVYAAAGPTSGYHWSGVLPAGNHQVCAFAINVGYGTTNPLLGCRAVTTVGGAAANPQGSLDGAVAGPGTISAVGWAYDVDSPAAPVQVHVYLDGAFAGYVNADGQRADVGRVISGAGDWHGFSWSGTASPGTHQVCFYAINIGAGNGNPQLGCRTLSVTDPAKEHDPIGSLDGVATSATMLAFSGWGLDPDVPTQPAWVHVYMDGAFLTAVTAGDARSDIAALYPAAGPAHGFNWVGTVPAGRHQICAYAINVGQGTGVNPLLGCRTATVG
jgi:hypothetical protein